MKTNDRLVELVKGVKAGNSDAFTDLYNESYKYLYTCVIHIVKKEDVAQDMLQDAYVEIYKNIRQLKNDEDFLGWASTIANRKCFAYIKKDRDILVDNQTDDEGNETNYFESIADDEAFIPENIMDDQEKVKLIRNIIDELTDVQRACVIGFYYNEQKQDEIANELGIPVNTVKSHLNRAKSKIKEAVGEIENKQGIRLYSVAPFMLLFFMKDAEAYAAELTVPAMSAGLSSTIGSGAAGNVAGNATAGSNAAGNVAATGAKAAGIAVKTKVIAGIVAGVAVIGGIVGLTVFNGKGEEADIPDQTIVEESQQQEQALAEEQPIDNDEISGQDVEEETKKVVASSGEPGITKVLSQDETEYDGFGGAYGGVLITQKGDLYGAVDYEMNEIVPCKYTGFQAPNNHGYFVLSDAEQNYLFSPEGELIFSTGDNLRTMGGGYATSNNSDWSDTTVKYYDYAGNFLAETDMAGEAYPHIIGFHDSCILVKRADVDYENNHTVVELGKIGEDGTTTWQTEYDGWTTQTFQSDDPSVNAAGASYYCPTVLMSGMNDGYYLDYLGPGIEWGLFMIRDADSNLVATVNACHMDSNGNYSESNYIEENDIKGYYYDGCYFYNRGTKMVWMCGDKYILVDTLDPKPLAIYDYICMAEDDLWFIQDGEQYGYIDPSGNVIAMFDDASAFSNGHALVLKDGVACLVDTNLNVIEELGEADSVGTYGELFAYIKDGNLNMFRVDN